MGPWAGRQADLLRVHWGDLNCLRRSACRLRGDLPAILKGASKMMVVYRHPDRLKLMDESGAIAIDDSKVDLVEAVNEMTMGSALTTAASAWGSRRTTSRATRTRK